MSDIVRVLRILEYVGPRHLVEGTLDRGAVPTNGTWGTNGINSMTIRSAVIGSYPEILQKEGKADGEN